MKRSSGIRRALYLDLNKQILQQKKENSSIIVFDKKRRPYTSRIEEKIRMRKLNVNNKNNNADRTDNKSPVAESVVHRSPNINGLSNTNRSNSCDSLSENYTNSVQSDGNNCAGVSSSSCSSSSNSNENFTNICDSKERVELLEIKSNNSNKIPASGNTRYSKKNNFNRRWKINGEKLVNSIRNNNNASGSSKIKARTRSAPCYVNASPPAALFEIKYAKSGFNRYNNTRESGKPNDNHFIDCKIVEKDCIAFDDRAIVESDKQFDEMIGHNDDDQPIGNPELISVMKESLDKIMKENLIKSSKLIYTEEEINNNVESIDDPLQSNDLIDSNFAPRESSRSSKEINETEENVAPQSTKNEILLKSSASLQKIRSNEYLAENHEAEMPQQCFTGSKDRGKILRSDENEDESHKKCCVCRREKKMPEMRKRVNFSPRNLIISTESSDRNCNALQNQKNGISNMDFNGCRKSVLLIDNTTSRPSSGLKKCETGYNSCSEQVSLSSQAEEGEGSVDVFQSCENFFEGINSRPKSFGRSRPNSAPRKICSCVYGRENPTKFSNNYPACRSSNFESTNDGDSETMKYSPNFGNTCKSKCKAKSCDNCNRFGSRTICCQRISTHRSKSTPRRRRVTFCLPSLIPEELENSCDRLNVSKDTETTTKKEENHSLQICKCDETECPAATNVKKSDLQDSERNFQRDHFFNSNFEASVKFGEISRCRCNVPYHSGFLRKSIKSQPRVHFCKQTMNKHPDNIVVSEDFNNPQALSSQELNIIGDSGSKTSVTSDKEWNNDSTAGENNSNDYFIRDISFPKETRQAMNVLLQSNRGNNYHSTIKQEEKLRLHDESVSELGFQNKGQIRTRKEVQTWNKPAESKISNSARQETRTHMPSYAQALAVFQRTCDPLQEGGGRCKIKRRIVRKGSDGEINSEYTASAESEFNPGSIIKQEEKGQRQQEEEHQNIILLKRNKNCRYPNTHFHLIHNNSNRNNKLDPKTNLNRTFNVPEKSTGLVTMQTNGSDNGSSENGVDRTGWTVGLINGRFKYLTAETFGFKINANGASLKKKQLWTLEGSEHQVFLRSHLDRYLAVDQFGNVTCEAEDTADPGCAFQIQVASDGSGRWALKNIQRGYFLGSSQDELKCTAKVPGDAEYWLVHLAARPQVNLRSAGRKRFAHLSAAQDEIHVDAPVPWGEDTLFTLEFRPAAMPDNPVDGNGDVRRDVRSEAGIGGHYALHTCNNKYLARDGKLLDSCTRDCLYAAEFHAGMLALRDVSGAYLAPIGSKAVLKSRSNTVTRDELFSLEDSLPQASFVAALNQRYVSVKQGVDVTANQDEISGHETFQLEFDRATKRWYLRTMQDRYWTLEAGGGIQASDHKRSSNALFDLVWQPADGTVALRANNGKFLATKRSGHLYANADSPGDSEASKFYFYLMNRPVLVLRCEQGFVGLKSNASPKLECNKASYETIRVERCDRGIVRFKGQNGKYWHADSEGVTSDADVPSDGFYLELREPSRICIKSTDGRYLSAGKNGVFRLGDTDYESATKWEF